MDSVDLVAGPDVQAATPRYPYVGLGHRAKGVGYQPTLLKYIVK